jgi:NAD(P)-dependent dehydrogenase (short-subunit alcohol dehydrogenase family)
MSIDLNKAVAVVSGGGSGVGRASAHALARRGTQVVVTDIDLDRATKVASELGRQGLAIRCDVTNLEDLEVVRDRTLDRFGRVDLVMNNVAVLAVGPVEAIPLEAWQRAIDVNLMSIVRSNLIFLPILLSQGSGHIVNTASTAGLLPYGFDRLPYTSTKHAIVGLSQSLALYLRPLGIGVSCFCPAGMKTNIVEQITYYGDAASQRGPGFPVVEAELAGELVAEGVAQDRFLILTAPEAADEVRNLSADVDAYLQRLMDQGN